MAQYRRRTIRTMLRRLAIGGVLLVGLLAGSAWVATQVFGPRQPVQEQTLEPQVDVSLFDYVVSVEPNRLRVSGMANVPNGVVLIGTLDKIGLGPLAVKEALVVNHLFVMEFGPELRGQLAWLGQTETLMAGTYRLSVEFDPAQQSPFVRESLVRGNPNLTTSTTKGTLREVDPALFRVAKTFAIGTREEQQAAQAQEEQYRQASRQHLDEAMVALTSLWQQLWAQYLQDRTQGGFTRTDPRASAWQDWSGQWLNELRMLGEKYQLREATSAAAPYRFLRDTLATIYRRMPVVNDLYFAVLVHERSPNDQELQRAEQQLRSALGDAAAQLGHPNNSQPTVKPDSHRSTVIVTSPLVNVRSGPGMDHEVFSQMKKDEVVDFLGEQGEWFQVKLPNGRVGWVHHNVASKGVRANGVTDAAKWGDDNPVLSERRMTLNIEPVALQATPVDYLPRPTPDELQIYADVERQLRDLPGGGMAERQVAERRVVRQASEKYGLSPGLLWNVYLKVQGWEIRQ